MSELVATAPAKLLDSRASTPNSCRRSWSSLPSTCTEGLSSSSPPRRWAPSIRSSLRRPWAPERKGWFRPTGDSRPLPTCPMSSPTKRVSRACSRVGDLGAAGACMFRIAVHTVELKTSAVRVQACRCARPRLGMRTPRSTSDTYNTDGALDASFSDDGSRRRTSVAGSPHPEPLTCRADLARGCTGRSQWHQRRSSGVRHRAASASDVLGRSRPFCARPWTGDEAG